MKKKKSRKVKKLKKALAQPVPRSGPEGRYCSNCAAYNSGDSTCHVMAPSFQNATPPKPPFFPSVQTTDWCIDWLSFEQSQAIMAGKRKR